MGKKIKYIQIYGERNSGTNYLDKLLQKNISEVEIGYKYGWKHGYTNLKKILKTDNKNTLFIHITKDPYAWLSSMHEKPHHAPQLYFKSFEEFIRSEWACYKGKQYQIRAKNLDKEPLLPEDEMMRERNPVTGQRYENVCELRNAKMHRYIRLEKFVENYKHIQYENLLRSREMVFQQLAEEYSLKVNDTILNDSGYHGKNPTQNFSKLEFYNNKEYLKKYSKEDIKYVNTIINFKNENILGYERVT